MQEKLKKYEEKDLKVREQLEKKQHDIRRENEMRKKLKDEQLMMNSMKKEEMTKEQLKQYEEKMT